MKYLSLVLTLAGLATPALTHEGHHHEAAVEVAPHGGMLRDALPFKSEIVLSGDQVTLYIYDKALKPIQLDQETLQGDYQFPRGKKKTVTFKRSGDHYQAAIAGISKVHRFDLHVTLQVGGQKAWADFGIDNL